MKNKNSKKTIRLDKYIADMNSDGKDVISRSFAQKLIQGGGVLVNGQLCLDKAYLISSGDTVDIVGISEEEAEEEEILAEDIPLDVVYEDEDIIVVDKKKGMLIHPTHHNEGGTLVNALLFRLGDDLKKVGDPKRPGIVHRLDKDTGGLVVVAKTQVAYDDLRKQFDRGKVHKKYIALCYNMVPKKNGLIDRPIGLNEKGTMKRKIDGKDARRAVTEYHLVERLGSYSLVEIILHTGRTHQIRVHMASLGCPLVGDRLYGPKNDRFRLDGQALYAQYLGFQHPTSKEFISFTCEMPDWFKKAIYKTQRFS